MDPQLSGFALGLLFGAAKVGLIGTLGFGIAWWRARGRLRRYEEGLPDPGRLEERLASLEQTSEYTTAKLAELVDMQADVLRTIRADAPRARLSAAAETLERRNTPV
jgi:hypothetical protein